MLRSIHSSAQYLMAARYRNRLAPRIHHRIRTRARQLSFNPLITQTRAQFRNEQEAEQQHQVVITRMMTGPTLIANAAVERDDYLSTGERTYTTAANINRGSQSFGEVADTPVAISNAAPLNAEQAGRTVVRQRPSQR